MGDLKLIKNRIQSISNTSQITNAMQMVSATKMIKAQQKALHAIPYGALIYEIVSKIGSIKDYKSIYLREIKNVENIGIVVIGTARGFVGSLISNLTNQTYQLKQDLQQQFPEAKFKGISLHKTGLKILHNAGIQSDLHFSQYYENKNTTHLTPVFQTLIERFINHDYDLIYLVHTHFISTVNQKPIAKQILPISMEELAKESKEHKSITKPFLFEPNIETILEKLLPEYFQTQIFTGILESIASEHSARMVAMKNATDNAKELKNKLTLKYNRQRQAQITQQLIEVVNGRKKKKININNQI
jgi:F-type H+-transporting ATPase subunit gamma